MGVVVVVVVIVVTLLNRFSFVSFSILLSILMLILLVTTSSTSHQVVAATIQTSRTTTNNSNKSPVDVLVYNGTIPKIVGGTEVSYGTYKSYAHVLGPGSLCGGTLIYPDIILTAAHCESSFYYDRLIAIGATIRNGSDAYEILRVQATYKHPSYTRSNFTYDFMLVKMNSTSTAPVLEMNTNPLIPIDYETVKVIGFGTLFSGGPFSNVLLDVDLNIVPYTTCYSNYNNLLITNSIMICAAAPNKDACQGDSGGPMFDTTTQPNTIIGIVSFGDGCAKVGKPGVYSRVSAVIDFIQQGICDLSNNQPQPSYCTTRQPSILPSTQPSSVSPKIPTSSTISPSARICETDSNTSIFGFLGRQVLMYRDSFFFIRLTCTEGCKPITFLFLYQILGWKSGSCKV